MGVCVCVWGHECMGIIRVYGCVCVSVPLCSSPTDSEEDSESGSGESGSGESGSEESEEGSDDEEEEGSSSEEEDTLETLKKRFGKKTEKEVKLKLDREECFVYC